MSKLSSGLCTDSASGAMPNRPPLQAPLPGPTGLLFRPPWGEGFLKWREIYRVYIADGLFEIDLKKGKS